MKTILLAIILSAFALGPVMTPAAAQSTAACEAQAVGKDGKPLAGAAKTAFVNKCMKDSCTANAVDKNGRKLAGAALTSFVKKCQAQKEAQK